MTLMTTFSSYLRAIKEDDCGFLEAGMAGEGSLHRDDH